MEQAAKRQDRGEGEEEQHGTPAPPAVPEEPFSLLQELPGPLMRQLVQRHLDATDCLALLRTSHALARAVAQHRMHQQRGALTWTCKARNLEGSEELSSMDGPQAATAASLLVRWAPAELRVALCGTWPVCTLFSLPAALLPLITSLRLHQMHLTPAVMDSLQRCQRLHTLDVDECAFLEASRARPATQGLQALPLLHTFRHASGATSAAWPSRGLGALCALATEVRTALPVTPQWLPSFARVTSWQLEDTSLTSPDLEALLGFPSLRRVRAAGLFLDQDHSQQACPWETLTLGSLEYPEQLALLPSGLARVTVAAFLRCGDAPADDVAEVLRRWCAPGRLQTRVDAPPKGSLVARWRLGGEEQRLGFFPLFLLRPEAAVAWAPLLQRTALPPGGGPHTLELVLHVRCPLALTLRRLAPLMAGAGVRTLCMWLDREHVALDGALAALPSGLACLRLSVEDAEHAEEVLRAHEVAHPLRTLVLLLRSAMPEGEAQQVERRLRELCAAHQPLVQRLDVLPWGQQR